MPKAYFSTLSVDDFGSPDTFIVTTAMLNAFQHRGHVFIRFKTDYPGNATHNKSVMSQWSVVSSQWSVVSGQWSVVSSQWSVVNVSIVTDKGQRTTDN